MDFIINSMKNTLHDNIKKEILHEPCRISMEFSILKIQQVKRADSLKFIKSISHNKPSNYNFDLLEVEFCWQLI